MTKRDRNGLIVRAILAIVAAAACSHTVGPSLSATVETQALVPTLTLPQFVPTGATPSGDPASLCCCRVVGTVRNTSTVPVNLNLFFHATTRDGQCPGNLQNTQDGCTGQDSLVNVPAGGTAGYSAPGILKACDTVSSVALDMTVTGIWFPSSAP